MARELGHFGQKTLVEIARMEAFFITEWRHGSHLREAEPFGIP
jgi:hypothetical protein